MSDRVLIVIPVRMASTRLPGKPLADICGKTMINHVYDRAIKANLGEVVIACDGEEIAKEATKIGAKYVITNPNLPSGTDRIHAAYEELAKDGSDYDVILSLQGDLPDIDPELIKASANLALNGKCDIATLAYKIDDASEITNPNVVKIAISFKGEKSGKALYFSREAIPHSKNNDKDYFHHIGIYAYKKEALKRFVKLEQSRLEKRESLEQLRALEDDMSIFVEVVDKFPTSVDTKEDLESIRKKLGNE